jgi:hypothetical protein
VRVGSVVVAMCHFCACRSDPNDVAVGSVDQRVEQQRLCQPASQDVEIAAVSSSISH